MHELESHQKLIKGIVPLPRLDWYYKVERPSWQIADKFQADFLLGLLENTNFH